MLGNFQSYHKDGALIVSLSGEYDLSNVAQLELRLSAASREAPNVILDLTAVRYVDSTVLALFVRLHEAAGERIRYVVPADSHIRRLFSITSLDTLFIVKDTLAQALAEERPPAG